VAREVARGEPTPPVIERVLPALPPGSTIRVDPGGDAAGSGTATATVSATASVTATVTVSAPLPAPPALRSLLGDRRLSASVTAPDERSE